MPVPSQALPVNFTLKYHSYLPGKYHESLEKEMATHSSIPAWKIPWTEEHGRLQSMGSQRVGHDLAAKPLPPSIPLFEYNKYIYFHY